MEAKKVILVLLLALVLFPLANAQITNYSVPSSVPLNQTVSATGISIDDSNVPVSNQLCSFYFLDSSGNLVDRATDQYTDQTGRFAMFDFQITEPDFQRLQSFTLLTVCGSSEADANFTIDQRQELIPFLPIYQQGFTLDLLFWTNPENIQFAVYFLIIAVIVIVLLIGIAREMKLI